MIQNFGNDNAEQLFLGYAPIFDSNFSPVAVREMTLDLRILDAIESEKDLFSHFRERVDNIEGSDGDYRVKLKESPLSEFPYSITFRLLDGDVHNLSVVQFAESASGGGKVCEEA